MAEPAQRLSGYAEYLVAELCSEVKHEYIDGYVVAMAGGTIAHGELAAALTVVIGVALRGRPCRVYNSDVRVHVESSGLTTYPDLTVVCGARRTAAVDANALTNPVLLVEVLSPSTEAYDRGEKFEHYQRIPSLREYVLASPGRPRIERFTRNADETWTYALHGPGDTVQLASLGVTLDVTELYAALAPPEG